MSEATISSEPAEPTSPNSAEIPIVPSKRKIMDLTTATAISFSLTFVGVSVMLLAGMMPSSFSSIAAPVDIGVVLLIVPLCALVLAMMAEVLRAAIKSTPPRYVPRTVTSLSEWRPGPREG